MGRQVNEREIVLAVLMEITENGAYSHKILGEVLSKYQYLEKKERAFITRVTEGTLEHLIEIDYILDQFSKVKVKKDETGDPQYLKKRSLPVKIYGQRTGSCGVQRGSQTGSKKRLFRIKGVCERSAAECGKRTGYIGLSAGRN